MSDLYADENEPVSEFYATVYRVKFPRPGEFNYWIYIEVDQYGMLILQDHTFFCGKTFRNMSRNERSEVYEFLVEWELAEWKQIGPEDRELFATERLTREEAHPSL